MYEYPDIWVCLYGEYGCDSWDLEEECTDSAQLTGWGNTSAVFYPGGDYEQTIPGVGILTPDVREVDVERTYRHPCCRRFPQGVVQTVSS